MSKQISASIPDEVQVAISNLAKKEKRSFSSMVEVLLTNAIPDRENAHIKLLQLKENPFKVTGKYIDLDKI